jgi:hypothetical protein
VSISRINSALRWASGSADVAHDVADLCALVSEVLARDAAAALEHVHRVLPVRVGRTSQVVETAVARDPVEPGPCDDRPLVGDHRAVG